MQGQEGIQWARDRAGAVPGARVAPFGAVGRERRFRPNRLKCQRTLVGLCSELTCQTHTTRVAGSAVAETTPKMGVPKPRLSEEALFLPCSCSLPRSKIRPGSVRAQGAKLQWSGGAVETILDPTLKGVQSANAERTKLRVTALIRRTQDKHGNMEN